MVWLICGLVLAFIVIVAAKTHALKQGRELPPHGFMNKAAHAWYAEIIKQEKKSAATALPKPAAQQDTAERLEEMFGRYKSGAISLFDYQDEIVAARDDVKLELDMLKAQRSFLDDDDYNEERERLREEADEVTWRLDWVTKRLKDQALLATRPEIAGQGRWARFEYADQYGEVTDRDVTNWEVSGRYVRGFDRKRKAERTFRIDRINDWKAG